MKDKMTPREAGQWKLWHSGALPHPPMATHRSGQRYYREQNGKCWIWKDNQWIENYQSYAPENAERI